MFKAQYYRLRVKHSLRASNANDFLHEAITLSLSSAEQCSCFNGQLLCPLCYLYN